MSKFYVDDLIERGLVNRRTYTEGPYAGLSVLKYDRSVFFNHLWRVDERLLECRGRVIDEDNNIIVNPFRKVFNLHEEGTEIDPDHNIMAIRKVNGFLGCVTNTEKYGVIYSTTGSLDSDFVPLIEKWVPRELAETFNTNLTFMFEICDSSDPHIIAEKEGAVFIGARLIKSGQLMTEAVLDLVAYNTDLRRPEEWWGKFKNLPDTKMEGYMIRDLNTEKVLAKLKSPTYLSKKALQRCGKNKAAKMWNNPQEFMKSLDEEFYDVFEAILDTFTQEEYLALTEQERRKWIENYFGENNE